MRPRLSERGEFDATVIFKPGELAVLTRVSVKTLWTWDVPSFRGPATGSHRRYRREYMFFVPAAGDPQLLHPAEVADALRLCESTIRKMISNEELKAWVLPNGQPRVSRTDLDAFLAGCFR